MSHKNKRKKSYIARIFALFDYSYLHFRLYTVFLSWDAQKYKSANTGIFIPYLRFYYKLFIQHFTYCIFRFVCQQARNHSNKRARQSSGYEQWGDIIENTETLKGQ